MRRLRGLVLAGLLVAAQGSTARARPELTLLYSTLGYESGGSKRALVRGLGDTTGEAIDPAGSRWRLLDADGRTLLEGPLQPRGTTFGAPLWEIDLSSWRGARTGLRLSVQVQADGPVSLESRPFPVETGLYTRRLVRGLSLHNARLRRAPDAMGGGYYDCNSQMGEAYSHAMFAAGLVDVHVRRSASLSQRERAQLLEEIHRAIDYVVGLHDDETGEIANQHPSRPGGNAGAFNTQEGVYGLTSYLALGSAADPVRAADVARRAQRSLAYLESRGELYPELGAAAYARLHAHGGHASDLEAGIQQVEALLYSFDPRTRFRHPLRGVPWFEGLALLAPVVEQTRRHRWTAWARSTAESLLGAASRNGYGIVPALGPAEWDDASTVPVSRVEHAFYGNAHVLAMTVDALYLSDFANDPRLEALAAAGLQWVTGVNPGLPASVVTNPGPARGEPARLAAAFVVNGAGRFALPWKRWWWRGFDGTPSALTVTQGFVAPEGRGLVYDVDAWPPAETFIRTDGLLLRAALLYEDRLGAARP